MEKLRILRRPFEGLIQLGEKWEMAGNLNYRQARQEAHQISGRNLLPGLPVIHIYSLTLVVPKTGNELR